MIYLLLGIAIIALWIYGEYSNNRPLRLSAILVPTLIVGPIGFEFGLMFGHGRAYVKCRTQTCAFLEETVKALDEGRTSQVIDRLKWLRSQNDNVDQHAGSFFVNEM